MMLLSIFLSLFLSFFTALIYGEPGEHGGISSI